MTKQIRIVCTALLAIGVVVSTPSTDADEITYLGETYRDVLVYESPSLYYVKVPIDGRIFNVPKSAVQRDQIRIDRDPYYRDELKRLFESNEVKTTRSGSVTGSAFNTTGGAAAVAAGVDLDAVRGALEGAGFSIEDSESGFVASNPAFGATITIAATSMNVRVGVPEAQLPLLQGMLGQMGPQLGAFGDWIPTWLTNDVVPLLAAGGSTEKTEGGVAATASVEKAGGNLNLELDLSAAG